MRFLQFCIEKIYIEMVKRIPANIKKWDDAKLGEHMREHHPAYYPVYELINTAHMAFKAKDYKKSLKIFRDHVAAERKFFHPLPVPKERITSGKELIKMIEDEILEEEKCFIKKP